MSKITLESISKILSEEGWSCQSEKYVNLDTEMTFLCSRKHSVLSTWRTIRKRRDCPQCLLEDSVAIDRSKVLPKTEGMRVLALDQSTNKTGYSIYDGNKLIMYGVFQARGELFERMFSMAAWLKKMLAAWQPDYIGFEDTQQNDEDKALVGYNTFKTLTIFLGVLIYQAHQSNVMWELIPISTWRSHCSIKGAVRHEQKANALRMVKRWYNLDVSEDAAEAICIGRYLSYKYQPRKIIGEVIDK